MKARNTSQISTSADETFNLGLELAKELDQGCCLLLTGTLGAGKTQFIKGFASYFHILPSDVQSPTYSLHHVYEGTSKIHHFDLYRLSGTKEFLERGFFDILQQNEYYLIEWPSKIDQSLFTGMRIIDIHIKILDENTREIKIFT